VSQKRSQAQGTGARLPAQKEKSIYGG